MLPRPTRRAVVDVGSKCNLACVHCYHKHITNKQYLPTYQLKVEIARAKDRGNNYIDFTGGCVELHPGIFELIEYCNELELKCCIITTGIMGSTLSERLLNAGVDDFLVSIHWQAMKNLDGSEIDAKGPQEAFLKQAQEYHSWKDDRLFRFNCCMLKQNQNELVDAAKWAAVWKPRIFNFINFNPHHGWKSDIEGTKSNMANFDIVERQLCEAIPILLDAGIGVNVRYYPMCRLPEAFRQHICNDLQVCFDPYEWDYGCSPKTFSAYYNHGVEISRSAEWKGQPCLQCDLKFICGGINKAFYQASEMKGIVIPIKDEFVVRDDIYHYRRQNIVCLTPRIPTKEKLCVATIADDSTAAYVPMFLHRAIKINPDAGVRIFSRYSDHGNVKNIVDHHIGYGIYDQCVVRIDGENGQLVDNPEIIDKIKPEKEKMLQEQYEKIEWINTRVEMMDDPVFLKITDECALLSDELAHVVASWIKSKKDTVDKARIEEHADTKKSVSQKTSTIKHCPGKMLVYTVVDEGYMWYVPMFIYSLNLSYPNLNCHITLRGNPDKDMIDICKKTGKNFSMDFMANIDMGPYSTQCLRFLVEPPTATDYDYCLITDVDILIFKEINSIIDQHMYHLAKDGTGCYENWISQKRGDEIRIPGVHFVTREWWEASKASREKELKTLLNTGANEYNYDEFMLGRIVRDSGLSLPPTWTKANKLWRNHGIHLGDLRINIERKKKASRPDVYVLMHIRTLLDDKKFMEIAEECQRRIPFLEKVFKVWPDYFK